MTSPQSVEQPLRSARLRARLPGRRRAVRLAACLTLGLPFAVTRGIRGALRHAAAGLGDQAAFLAATGFVGALGLHLFERPIARRHVRWPVRIAAWPLCLLGLFWFAWIGWPLGMALCLPFIAARGIERLVTRPPDQPLPLPAWATFALSGAGVAVLVNLVRVARALGPAALVISVLAALIAPVLIGFRSPHRRQLVTGFLGLPGLLYLRANLAPGPRRVLFRVVAWLLCVVHAAVFAVWGWLFAPRVVYAILAFPVALTGLLEHVYRKAAGDNWYRPGFRIATAFVGDLGLRLFRRPIARRWLRWPARWLAWPMCLLGLLWFRAWGFWAFLLVPLLRLGPRLRAAPHQPREPDYTNRPLLFRLEPLDWVSLALIAVVAAMLWVARPRLVTFAPDGYYHLLVARRIAEDGLVLRPQLWDYVREGVVPRWDWWQYAPAGRPHLYPPLLHLLTAVLSLPFEKDVEEGMRVLQALVLPGTLLSTWYLGRWLFDARRGFLAMLLAGMGFFLVTLAIFALPSVLANVMLPFLLVLFLKRWFWPVAGLMALLLYAHLGVGVLALAGLLLFSLWHREYFWFCLGTLALAAVLALPWYGHVWVFRDWLGNPMAQIMGEGFGGRVLGVYMKMKWLLMLDLVVVLLVLRAWRMVPWSERRYRLLLCNVVGFLPMFLEYGGRYFFHTAQVWSLIAVAPLVRFVSPPLRARRVALVVVVAFLFPPLVLSGRDHGIGLALHPMPSGWTMTAVVMAAGNAWFGGGEDGQISHGDAVLLGSYIEGVTEPCQIIHVVGEGGPTAGAHLAVTFAYHANRRTSAAAWPEVRPADPDVAAKALADPRGCFVARSPEHLPEGFDTRTFLGWYIGLPAQS